MKKLGTYAAKRDFTITSEPPARVPKREGHSFVVQKHAARRLHYDFRLELGGVLKSWAVPKGPSLSHGEKRLAVEVEDHPIDYRDFEGTIPEGQYGGGEVIVWDRGTWAPVGDAEEGLRKGHLRFVLKSEKLTGGWSLVRIGSRDGEKHTNWLLVKARDEYELEGAAAEITEKKPDSVLSGRTVEELATAPAPPPPGSKVRAKAATTKRASKGAKAADEKSARPLKRAGAKRATAGAKRTTAGAKRATAGAKRTTKKSATKKSATKKSATKKSATKKSAAKSDSIAVLEQFEPQLATLVDHVPTEPGWLFEMKLDGYRAISVVEGGEARVISRNGLDWTDRFSDIAAALGRLRVKNAVLDGEVCVVDDEGKTSFQNLQQALSAKAQERLVYFVFDLLYRDGEDLRSMPLLERKHVLATILAGEKAPLALSAHMADVGEAMFDEAKRLGLEGIMAKRADASYTSGRTRSWLKIKCGKRQELVIIGYTAPTGKRTGLGALVLGVHEPGKKGALRFVGKVGTGFTASSLAALRRKLEPLARAKAPVPDAPRVPRVTWVEPEVVCEVGFTEWTHDGALRHPTFLGLREDKPSEDVVRERAASTTAPKSPRAAARSRATGPSRRVRGPESIEIEGVTITHEGRVLDPASELTKGDLARYYAAVAGELLPYAEGRPLSIVRCTSGIGKGAFFQKHAMPGLGEAVHRSPVGEHEVLSISDAEGLLQLVQFGGVELHAWGARLPDADKPDMIVLDFDPDEGLAYGRVVEAALDAREQLRSIGLESWVKTTGGKGLHVIVPFRPMHGWDVVKKFSRVLAEDFVRRQPEAYTATLAKAARRGRIFVDYLRNGEGATAVLPYSARARTGLTVAMPIPWEDVRHVHPKDFTISTVPDLLARRRRDPWADLLASKQRLPDNLDELVKAGATASGSRSR